MIEKTLNRIIEVGIIVLIVFTPLAFGSVEVWATETMKILIFIVATAWLLKKIWAPLETRSTDLRTKWKRWMRTGLEIPALLFIIFVLFQMIPFPPSVVKFLSPESYSLYKATLPGYDTPEGVDFSKLDSWLLGQQKDLPDGLREIILKEAKEKKDQAFNIQNSNYRPISVYSYLTRENLILLFAYLMIFFIIIDHYRTRTKIYNLLLIIIVTGLLIASFGIVQKLTWNGKIYWLRDPGAGVNPFGPFVNPDHFAGYMELITPLAFGLFFTLISRRIESRAGKLKWEVDMGRERWNLTEVQEYSFQKAVTLGLLLAITIASVFMSLSRGGLVATSITFLVFAFLLFLGKRKSFMEIIAMSSVLVISFAVLLAVGLTPVKERLETLAGISVESGFFKSRLVVWQHTWDLIKDFPVFGSGLGTFRQAFLSYYPSGSENIWLQTHNDYLQLLSEVGFLGFVIFLSGLVVFIYKYYRKAVFGRHSLDRYTNLGLAMAIFSMGLHSFVDFNLQIPSNGFLFVVITALLIAKIFWSEESREELSQER